MNPPSEKDIQAALEHGLWLATLYSLSVEGRMLADLALELQRLRGRSELFPADTAIADSPRLAWQRKYGISTRRLGLENLGDHQWIATIGGVEDVYFGQTEIEALAALAAARGLKLWNEERV